MARRFGWALVAAVAIGGWTGTAPAEDSAPDAGRLRHAVVCPPFKGPADLAGLYHAEMVRMLQECEGIEFLEGSRAQARRAPEFTYRINGAIVDGEDGQFYVTVTLMDGARKEAIGSHIAPASTHPEAIAAWRRTLWTDMQRRVGNMPFEARLRRQRGQTSYTLDRGLDSGLQPGRILDVARDDVALLCPRTGVLIGRETVRPVGQIEIFRVMDHVAYGRPVDGAELPRSGALHAREF